MKKPITLFLIIILLVATMVSGFGCSRKKYLSTETFIYYVSQDRGEDVVIIKGLTEKGRLQKNIVIPEEIDGMRVYEYHGYDDDAPNVKKIIVPYNITSINGGFLGPGQLFVRNHPSELKILYVNCRYSKFVDCSEPWNNFIADAAEKNYSFFTNLKYYDFANMQYLFNYEDAPNKGVFFIDDLEVNEKLEIFPETPKRDGYIFTGWFAEPECINKIELTDFEKTDDETIYLYAGWTENA